MAREKPNSPEVSDKVDILFTLVGDDDPPQLPLQQEFYSAGVELVYNAKDVGLKTVAEEQKRREDELIERLEAIEECFQESETSEIPSFSKKNRLGLKAPLLKDKAELLQEHAALMVKLDSNAPRAVSYETYSETLERFKLATKHSSSMDTEVKLEPALEESGNDINGAVSEQSDFNPSVNDRSFSFHTPIGSENSASECFMELDERNLLYPSSSSRISPHITIGNSNDEEVVTIDSLEDSTERRVENIAVLKSHENFFESRNLSIADDHITKTKMNGDQHETNNSSSSKIDNTVDKNKSVSLTNKNASKESPCVNQKHSNSEGLGATDSFEDNQKSRTLDTPDSYVDELKDRKLSNDMQPEPATVTGTTFFHDYADHFVDFSTALKYFTDGDRHLDTKSQSRKIAGIISNVDERRKETEDTVALGNLFNVDPSIIQQTSDFGSDAGSSAPIQTLEGQQDSKATIDNEVKEVNVPINLATNDNADFGNDTSPITEVDNECSQFHTMAPNTIKNHLNRHDDILSEDSNKKLEIRNLQQLNNQTQSNFNDDVSGQTRDENSKVFKRNESNTVESTNDSLPFHKKRFEDPIESNDVDDEEGEDFALEDQTIQPIDTNKAACHISKKEFSLSTGLESITPNETISYSCRRESESLCLRECTGVSDDKRVTPDTTKDDLEEKENNSVNFYDENSTTGGVDSDQNASTLKQPGTPGFVGDLNAGKMIPTSPLGDTKSVLECTVDISESESDSEHLVTIESPKTFAPNAQMDSIVFDADDLSYDNEFTSTEFSRGKDRNIFLPTTCLNGGSHESNYLGTTTLLARNTKPFSMKDEEKHDNDFRSTFKINKVARHRDAYSSDLDNNASTLFTDADVECFAHTNDSYDSSKAIETHKHRNEKIINEHDSESLISESYSLVSTIVGNDNSANDRDLKSRASPSLSLTPNDFLSLTYVSFLTVIGYISNRDAQTHEIVMRALQNNNNDKTEESRATLAARTMERPLTNKQTDVKNENRKKDAKTQIMKEGVMVFFMSLLILCVYLVNRDAQSKSMQLQVNQINTLIKTLEAKHALETQITEKQLRDAKSKFAKVKKKRNRTKKKLRLEKEHSPRNRNDTYEVQKMTHNFPNLTHDSGTHSLVTAKRTEENALNLFNDIDFSLSLTIFLSPTIHPSTKSNPSQLTRKYLSKERGSNNEERNPNFRFPIVDFFLVQSILEQ